MANLNETQNQNNDADALSFAIPESGYGSYLKNILPEDQRVLAGAFSVAMQQIRNIDQVQVEKFAQAAYSTENMFGLNLVNGTDVPTDQSLAKISQTVCALGGGVYGTYTMSNMFGAMSGLPYPLREIYNGITSLETDKLRNIYQELYLAVQWQGATAHVTPSTGSEIDYVGPGPTTYYKWYYEITGITLDIKGGGYNRGGAVAPLVNITGGSGATAVTTFSTDVNSVGSNGTGEYGRVLTISLTNPGTKVYYATGQISSTPGPIPSPPIVEIECPPTATLAVQSDGSKDTSGVNTAYLTSGWPSMNSVVQQYIDQANQEIQSIQTVSASNFENSNILNTNWLITGKALKQEQRARYISSSPVPAPDWDKWLAMYPQSIYTFVDAIPGLGGNTLPHMYAQTLENISDLNLVGGQSIIALMRESRNQVRLNNAGLQLDNTLASDLDVQSKTQLITNNTIPDAIDGVNGYTIPAFPGEVPSANTNGNPKVGVPVPASYYDPCLPGLMCYNEIQYVESNPIAAILSAPPPEPEPEPPPSPTGYEPPPTPEILPAGTDVPTPDFNFPCEGTVVDPIYGSKPAPVATSLVGTGAAVPCDPPTDYPLGVNQPKNIIPPELDAEFTSSGLTPSAPTVQQAIDQVIKCNCDCWVN